MTQASGRGPGPRQSRRPPRPEPAGATGVGVGVGAIGPPGLRERKKQQTRLAIADVAMQLFAARGFDAVTVADVAAAADVSVKTVFNYFPVKEALVLAEYDDLDSERLRAVLARAPGETVLAAVRRHTLTTAERLRALPPERRAALRKIIQAAPSIEAHWREHARRHEAALAQLLAEETGAPASDVLPAAVAGLLGVLARLGLCDVTGWPDGRQRSQARGAAEIARAFERLAQGLGGYAVRPAPGAPASAPASSRTPEAPQDPRDAPALAAPGAKK